MKTNITLNTVDIVILLILFVLMIGGCRAVYGFFHEGQAKLKKSTYNGKGAVKLTLAVKGMQCGHCEANVNDTIRKNFDVEKVTSSHLKGETIIIAKHNLDTQALTDAIAESGYTLVDVERENYRKKLRLS